MNTGIRGAIRKFVERNIIADDPLPQPSWLDQQDMPGQEIGAHSPVSGLPVAPLPPLTGRHSGLPHLQSLGRLKGRRAARVHGAPGSPSVNEKI
ncbi:hypothetical protein [Arthrobacter sp. ISL-28]|uniref:hypothetical protein n=1 Tax=Arthrobacter sp. ISL-28 TaxID=2819108 RepID=UPI001BE67B00|nr:hypothetical protein [Arthrobacter sp. ISL-28]MBT2519639.1 hypothetical protein [Arthrobacter sp. ISL-28]